MPWRGGGTGATKCRLQVCPVYKKCLSYVLRYKITFSVYESCPKITFPLQIYCFFLTYAKKCPEKRFLMHNLQGTLHKGMFAVG